MSRWTFLGNYFVIEIRFSILAIWKQLAQTRAAMALFVCLCWVLRHFDSIAVIARCLAYLKWRKTPEIIPSCTDGQLVYINPYTTLIEAHLKIISVNYFEFNVCFIVFNLPTLCGNGFQLHWRANKGRIETDHNSSPEHTQVS